jgi:hypothetical protein
MASVFVQGMSKHRVLRTDAVRLPRENGDRDYTVDFVAPGLASTSAPERPILSYRVKPGEEHLVRLKISINGADVVDQTLSDPVSRTFNAAVDVGVIDRGDNELRVFVPADPPGSVVVSDLILLYSADQELVLPDPDAPPPSTSGSGF